MPVQLWNTHKVATALAAGQVSVEEKFQYLVASNVIWVVSGYAGAYFVVPSSGWLYLYECLLVLVVTVFGLIRCREKYQGSGEGRLIEAVVVLSVPLSTKFLLFTWCAYAAVAWGLRWLLAGVEITPESPFELIDFLVKAAYRMYPFLIAVIGVAVYYLRLVVHLQTAAGASITPDISYMDSPGTQGN